jgi:hypothetical protein
MEHLSNEEAKSTLNLNTFEPLNNEHLNLELNNYLISVWLEFEIGWVINLCINFFL